MLAKSLKYSGHKYTTDYILSRLLEKTYALWVYGDITAAGITEVIEYPTKKVCLVAFAGGRDMPEWAKDMPTIEQWAKSVGCESIEIHGRKGWQRVFKTYQPVSTMISRSL